MARGDYPSAKQDQFVLRLPDGMREQIKEKAEANSRSMNAEIVAAIEAALEQPDLSTTQLREMLDEEREAYTRLEKLYDSAFDVALNYKDLLRSTKGRMLHFVTMLKSLTTMVIHTNGPPSDDLLDVARRLESSASNEKIILDAELRLVEEQAKTEDFDELIKRTGDLLNKTER